MATSKYVKEATKLGASKYAPVVAQIAANAASNTGAYNTGTTQQVGSLNAALGSMEAANATTQKRLGELGTESGTLYQQALAKSQSDWSAQQERMNQTNSNLMSSLQSEMAARGLTTQTGAASRMTNNMTFGNNISSAIQTMNEGALTRQGAAAGDTYKQMQGSAQMLHTGYTSRARGTTQAALNELYNTYLQKELELQGQKTVTEKEKQDYIYQTAMTLKEKAQQAAAEKAQAAAQNAISQGRLNLDTQKFQVNTQLAYDKMEAKAAQDNIANKLKAEGFSHKKAMDIATLAVKKGTLDLNVEKFRSAGANTGMSNARVQEIIAGLGS